MDIKTTDKMKIVTPKAGCKLHNKETDLYTKVIYLPLNASLDNWEEVYEDEAVKALHARMDKFEKLFEKIANILHIEI